MMPTLKSEFKKLLTVRSTYLLSLIALLLVGFISFYVIGYKNSPEDHFRNLVIAGSIIQIASIISVFCALAGLLLLAHEYRYNTMVYTLTASSSRSKVLASKIFVIMSYALVLSLVLGLLGLGLIAAGAAASGHNLPHQDINYLTFMAKTIFYCESFALVGLLFAALIRNQVGAIAALFILPNTLEGLLSLLLKQNSVYMPFTALQQVVQVPVAVVGMGREGNPITGQLSPVKGALVFLAYLVAGWIITWYLFLRRDAS